MRIFRPDPDGPERHDLPVTVLFIPYTPERRSNIGGYYAEHGCAYWGDPPCSSRPIYLLETNVEVYGACEEHIPHILERAVSQAQRFGGDYDDVQGFLHVLPLPRRIEIPLIPYDQRQIVYSNKLDFRHDIKVYRAREDPYYGVLVVEDSNGAILLQRTVPLKEGAAYGVDSSDAQHWIAEAIAVVDLAASSIERLDEALSRYTARLTEDSDFLGSSAVARVAFDRACSVFANADAAVFWIFQPNLALQGGTPLDALRSNNGLERVLQLIDSLKSWDVRMASRSKVLGDDKD